MPLQNNKDLDLESATINFKEAYLKSAQAKELIHVARDSKLFKSKIKSLDVSASELNKLSNSALELTNLLAQLVMTSGKVTYLVLLQNNTELRPGGGFIGNFALVEIEDKKIKDISVEDIYTIDGQLKEKLEPPKELKDKLGVDNFYLRDSNWSLDFELNAQTARDFYKKETGCDVDGVVAIDLTFIQDLLSKMGPLKLTDYNEEITAQTLFERGEYYSEIGFFPGSTQKKSFFSALTNSLIAKIIDGLTAIDTEKDQLTSYQAPWLALLLSAKDALAQKHLMLSSSNSNIATFIKTTVWDNPLPPAN